MNKDLEFSDIKVGVKYKVKPDYSGYCGSYFSCVDPDYIEVTSIGTKGGSNFSYTIHDSSGTRIDSCGNCLYAKHLIPLAPTIMQKCTTSLVEAACVLDNSEAYIAEINTAIDAATEVIKTTQTEVKRLKKLRAKFELI